MTQVPTLKTQQMQIGGIDCTSCAMKIENSSRDDGEKNDYHGYDH
jgi:hypothetical protein